MAFFEIVPRLSASQSLINRSYLGGASLFAEFTNSDRQTLRVVLAVAVVLAVLGVFVWLGIRMGRRLQQLRVQEIQAALSGLGFTLREDKDELLRLVRLFKIGQRGDARQVLNPFESALPANGSTLLMDYYFMVGSGKNRGGVRQTLALISSKRLELPFILAPQKFSSWLAQRFGAHDINFDGFPRFNGMFKLQSDNETAVRALFTPSVIEELERHPGVTLEARAGNLLMFRGGKWIKPEDFPQFLEEALQLAQLFVS